MTTIISGSVEIRDATGESIGVPGQRWTLEVVPVVLEALHGVVDLQPVEPEQQPTGRTPEAQWTGVDAQNQPVTVFIWADTPFDDNVSGPAEMEGQVS